MELLPTLGMVNPSSLYSHMVHYPLSPILPSFKLNVNSKPRGAPVGYIDCRNNGVYDPIKLSSTYNNTDVLLLVVDAFYVVCDDAEEIMYTPDMQVPL